MRRRLVLALLWLGLAAPSAALEADLWAPDTPEPGSVEAIREHTTAPEYLPATVAYLPEAPDAASPLEVLGRIPGAAGELSSVATVHGYFRRLAEASDRVEVEVIGHSEEGREILLARISDAANLARLDRLRQVTARLADPRTLPRAEAEALIAEGKPFYYLTGGLHSPETGSPEMLMELAYRLAVSERPEIELIRREVVVLITPVTEPDGRDRIVEWYYRHLRGRDLTYEQTREIGFAPYWGHYVFHDNNRDGMQLTQNLTVAIHEAWFDHHAQVLHDLHESLPLLYISTGHGPYSQAIDPVTINEWTQLAHHEAGALQAEGLPGVWTWGFWDGWWPGYLFSVANNHNATGRFYETFGNAVAETLERDLSDTRFVGKPVTEAQWYRPWPPGEKLVWSLRNNTNYMQAGVLKALEYTARHGDALLRSFWVKGARSLEKGRTEAPYAWLFPEEQRDPGRLALLVNQLRRHRIEVHRLSEEARVGGGSWPAGTYAVRMDQPYRNAAVNFLDVQRFPADEPNPPYDDVAWTWPLLYGVEGQRVDDRGVLDAAMEPVLDEVRPRGAIAGEGPVHLLADTGQNAVLGARLALGGRRVEVAEEPFEAGGRRYPAGSWILELPREQVADLAERFGLSFAAAGGRPEVATHEIGLPRLAVLHTWSTQATGWVRYLFDQEGLPYTLINPDDLKRGGLGARFDVILMPHQGGDFARLVHGTDPAHGPLAYSRTAEYPSHGVPDASEDITGGMGFAGLANLQRFVADGGTLITLLNAGTLVVDGGLVRDVRRASGFNTPGSELAARVLQPRHPVTYGYEEATSVFRGNGPLFDVPERYRGRVLVQLGTRRVGEPEEEEEAADAGPAGAPEDSPEPEAGKPAAAAKERPPGGGLVLSGYVSGEKELDGKPAILDVPVGRGRVLIFNFNPLHRHLNHSDFRFVYNALLNWNALP